jgi:hypothetical protein
VIKSSVSNALTAFSNSAFYRPELRRAVASPQVIDSQPQPSLSGELEAALDSLRALAPNWDGYGAPVVDPAVIDAAKSFIAKLPEELASRPHVVPMSNGTLQLEWHDGPKSLEFEFESPSSIRYLQWHPEQGIEHEDSFPVTNVGQAIDLIRWFTTGAGA